MHTIDTIYINGQFVTSHGSEVMTLQDPVTGADATHVRLADETDARAAIAAAVAAYDRHRAGTREQRMAWLQRLHDAVLAHERELVDTMVAEYGGPVATSTGTVRRAANAFASARRILGSYAFERRIGIANVVMEPLGVVGLITPWNANYSFICNKLAMALAAGSTGVIKPAELSAAQTALLTRVLHEADLPPGLFNIVTGRGDTVGAEITRHPDIAKISFTGSTAVGKTIARGAVDTMKRVTLELGGKSPTLLLDDADFAKAIPLAIGAATMNSGQACLAGTRLLVPAARLEEAQRMAAQAMGALHVGDPRDPATRIGPLVNQRQFERVQGYIRKGIEEGATLLAGGEGRPDGLQQGWFVRPTVFGNVRNDMTIAREEIFGPVLCVIPYRDEDEAIAIANDTPYGLHAYVFSGDLARANRVARRVIAGRVFINGLYDEPEAPFGGFRQSGLGREFGIHGFEQYLEPKALMGHEQAL
ncbi:aldehyde dehydrogenase (NAD+) [Pseudoduganella flava]|uniref:Aldehyde dehydrogenase (NAD+) n=1 Tax=Pseudoduganella flava TaxID=871742 RepID=A0A562PIH5_9BURK|nr:aldehyde dehydrogenase family protein [Pseudoduganella flava]QGZ41871.1 aldehyde dehydrogenase family protein [Pseudoduganella flava]TWI44275.1 aldehyde dehydrogenase (NAD+) [Pseudoduganella flava]